MEIQNLPPTPRLRRASKTPCLPAGRQIQKVFEERGQAVLIAIFVVFLALIVGALSFGAATVRRLQIARQNVLSHEAWIVAGTGAEEAVWRVRSAKNIPASFSLVVGGGTATITVTSPTPLTRTITSTGTVGSVTRSVQLSMQKNAQSISFTFGTQVGDGGLSMENNSTINGGVHSNGRMNGSVTSARVNGDVSIAEWSAAAVNQSWETFTDAYTFAQSNPIIDVAQRFIPTQTDTLDSVDLYLERVGSPSDITLRIVTESGGVPSTTQLQNVTIDASTVPTSLGWLQVNLGGSITLTSGTPYWIVLDASRNASKYYRWGSDSGNGYASGYGMYREDWNSGPAWAASARDFDFRVRLGGYQNEIDTIGVTGIVRAPNIDNSAITGNAFAEGLFRNTTITGGVSANTIQDCTVTGNASYNTRINCTVSGSSTTPITAPDAPDKIPLPITDTQITDLKNEAQAGGTIGTVALGNGENISLGPVKISGDLLLNNNNILTVNGTIWVTGNIDIDNGSYIKLSPSYGNLSGVVLTDGWIHVANNGTFQGSGTPGSYPMLLTTLACTGSSGTGCTHHTSAVDLHNNAEGVIFYASAGQVYLHNVVTVNQLTAYRVSMHQNDTLNYDSGLSNAQFSFGPASAWSVKSWQEIQ